MNTPETQAQTPRTDAFVSALSDAGANDFSQFLEKVELFGNAIEIELSAAKAENARLREALEACKEKAKFLANEDNYLESAFDPCELGSNIRDIAFAALNPAKDENKNS